MTQLTNQQIYDNALFGIRSQDYQQSTNGQHCAYRGISDHGQSLKCAIGHCISDDDGILWDVGGANASGTEIDTMAEMYPNIYSKYFTLEQLPLLLELQQAHDTVLPITSYFESAMKDIADEYDLVYTPPSCTTS